MTTTSDDIKAPADPASESGTVSDQGVKSCILVVDDDLHMQKLMAYNLRNSGYAVEACKQGEEALARVEAGGIDLVLLDVMMPGIGGLETLRRLHRTHADIPVIMVSAKGQVETVVDCIQEGAFDYIQKPFDIERLMLTVSNALTRSRLQNKVESLNSELKKHTGFGRIVGKSPGVRKVVELVQRAAQSGITVLILGESGTGKELVARSIHDNGGRKDGPFVSLNCAAIPETLLEAELFGHEKGAFTGATGSRVGKFEQAHGGTLFLDEIGEMAPSAQVRLLRALQEREVQRLGGTSPRKIDVHVVSSTNRNLEEEVQGGRFRADLYYRVAAFPIPLPRLRERAEDIPLLVDHFLQQWAIKHEKSRKNIHPDAMKVLEQYPWPGNVRELENVVDRACVIEDGDTITLASLPANIVRGEVPEGGGDARSTSIDSIRPLEDEVRDLIIRALKITAGNVSETAKRLKIGRATLYRKISKYKLRVSE
ncbi:MAG: sigma-54 dependent transcriptional regulator [Planctomycetota bacterium]